MACVSATFCSRSIQPIRCDFVAAFSGRTALVAAIGISDARRGHEVCATAEVINVEGKRVDFKVSASDGIGEIGSGTHQQFVIDLRSFNERLARSY